MKAVVIIMKHTYNEMPDRAKTERQVSDILGMEDTALCDAVRAVAEASGMDARRAQRLTRDADAIRKKLASVRPEDLQRLLAQIPPEQMAAIAGQLEKKKDQ